MLLEPEKALGYSYLTETELRREYRRFGHPSVTRLYRLLNRAGHKVELDTLEEIKRYYESC